MHPTTKLHHIAQRQGGVVRRSQAIAAGISDRQIAIRINSEKWIRIGNGTYRIFEMPGSKDLVRAAVAALPNAVASHNSAASIHDLSFVNTRVATVMVHSRTTHTFPGVQVFRSFDLAKNHIEEIDGLPVTSTARTVMDLAAQLHRRQLEALVDDALAAGKATVDDLIAVLHDVARKGKPGVTAMRDLLDRRYGESRRASILERRGNRLLRGAGLGHFLTECPSPGRQAVDSTSHTRIGLWPLSGTRSGGISRQRRLKGTAFATPRPSSTAGVFSGSRGSMSTTGQITLSHRSDLPSAGSSTDAPPFLWVPVHVSVQWNPGYAK
jgi:hypothetical protein